MVQSIRRQASTRKEIMANHFTASLLGLGTTQAILQEASPGHDIMDSEVPAHLRLFDKTVNKLDSAGYWAARRLVISKECVYICSAPKVIPRQGTFRYFFERKWHRSYLRLVDGKLAVWLSEANFIRNEVPDTFLDCHDCQVDLQQFGPEGWKFTITFTKTGKVCSLACSDKKRRGEFVSSIFKHREWLHRAGEHEILDTIPTREITSIHHLDGDFFERRENGASRKSSDIDAEKAFGQNNFAGAVHVPLMKLESVTEELNPKKKLERIEGFFVPTGFSPTARSNFTWDEGDLGLTFETSEGGHNNGRTFCFTFDVQGDLSRAMRCLQESSQSEISAFNRRHYWEQARSRGRGIMESWHVKSVSTILIVGLWAFSIAESQLQPEKDSVQYQIFDALDLCFTGAFCVELALNLFCYWLRPFLKDTWHLFDMVVVLSSLVAVIADRILRNQCEDCAPPMPGPLRVLRILRVFRAFVRLRELRKIILGVLASVIPLCNAVLLAFLILSIFSIFAVELFQEQAPYHFGNFVKAFYTLFSVALGRWPDDKLVPFDTEDGSTNWNTIIFFYVYVIVQVIVVLQLVVAVLLDNFFRAQMLAIEEEAMAEASAVNSTNTLYPLDPLLEDLAVNFTTSQDLELRIERFFNVMDIDRGGAISMDEFAQGLLRFHDELGSHPHRITMDDWNILTEDKFLCDYQGDLTKASFRVLMLKKFRQYVQRKLADAVRLLDNSIEVKANLMAQKYLLITAMHDHDALVQDSLDEFNRAGKWGEGTDSPRLSVTIGSPKLSGTHGDGEGHLPSLMKPVSIHKTPSPIRRSVSMLKAHPQSLHSEEVGDSRTTQDESHENDRPEDAFAEAVLLPLVSSRALEDTLFAQSGKNLLGSHRASQARLRLTKGQDQEGKMEPPKQETDSSESAGLDSTGVRDQTETDRNKAFSEGVVANVRALHCMLSAQPSSELAAFVPDLERLMREMTQTLQQQQPPRAGASLATSTTTRMNARAPSRQRIIQRHPLPRSQAPEYGVGVGASPTGRTELSSEASSTSATDDETAQNSTWQVAQSQPISPADCERKLASLEMTGGRETDSNFLASQGKTGFA